MEIDTTGQQIGLLSLLFLGKTWGNPQSDPDFVGSHDHAGNE
jgi:hypothetical protein